MLLGIDLGTTNVKAVLTEPNGRVVARASATVRLIHVADRGVEQDIEDIWSATLSAIGKLKDNGDLSHVKAVGISAQGGALQMLGPEGMPRGPVISWMDGRGRPYDDDLTRKLGNDWFVRHIGHGSSAMSMGQILRIADERNAPIGPEDNVGFVGDVIVSRLCGTRAHDATSLSIAMLHNPQRQAADPDVLQMLNISESQLPTLISVRTPAGRLLHDVAAETSLPAGIPVSPAVHDQYAASLGAGVTHAGDIMFGAGTAWVLLAVTAHLTEPATHAAFICTHPVEGLYGQMLSLVNGGSSFEWMTRLLGLIGRSVSEMDALIETASPGTEGLRFWPLLTAGGGAELAVGTRGQLIGLQLSHRPAHMLRAVIEGLGFELTRYLRLLEHGGIRPKRLVMCGGAAASRVTPQIVADVTRLPVVCTTESEMSALGAAMIARGLVEPDSDLAAISEAMSSPVRSVTPSKDSDPYQALLGEYVASLPKAVH